MKTQNSVKSRNTASSSSSIATRTRKAATPSATSRKRLRRLHRPVDDDEDEEVEIELSPGSSNPSPKERKRSREDKDGDGTILENPLCFIDFDEKEGSGATTTASASTDNAQGITSSICERDVDHHPLLSDEMDQLQFDLEKSLANAICSQRKLRTALKYLTSGAGPSTATSTNKQATTSSVSANKRKHPKQQQVSKKPATGVSTTSSSLAAKKNRTAGNKDRRLGGHDSQPSCSRSYYYAQQNHQMPDKFWSFIDQYTGHTTLTTTAEVVRELIRESDPDGAQSKPYLEIPEGKQSKRRPSSSASTAISPKISGGQSSKSALTSPTASSPSKKSKNANSLANRRESSPGNGEEATGVGRNLRGSDSSTSTTQTRKRGAPAAPATAPVAKKSRDGPGTRAQNGTASNTRSQSNSDSNGFSLGPLTERLVQALIEDCEGADDKNGQSTVTSDVKNGLSTAANSKALMKTLNLGNLKALENRIKKELIDQGLLDASDDQAERKAGAEHTELSRRDSRASITGRSSALDQFEECADDDEVTAELRRRQYELLCVQRTNHERLTNLMSKLESEIVKIPKEEAIRAADDEVLELCARFYGVAPTSRKPSSKKERDSLTKALKDRDKAIAKLKSCHQ